MEYSLSLTTRAQADTLERILRVTRHRGFRVQSLNMELHSSGANQQQSMQLIVSSERPLALLLTQLNKLIDVHNIELNEPASASATA